MQNKIVIIGAGGHGKVVLDAIDAQKKYQVIGFVDANTPVGTVVMNDHKIIASQNEIDTIKGKADYFIVAIGNNKVREELFEKMKRYFKPATIIHPSAVIGSNVKIGEGAVVLANSVINAFSVVGDNCIVNARTVVDHESKVGNHVHLSIGTMVGSNSEITDGFKTAVGANIEPFSKIS